MSVNNEHCSSSSNATADKLEQLRVTCENIIKVKTVESPQTLRKQGRRQCPQCNKVITRQHYYRHLETHNPTKTLQCTVENCISLFSTTESLRSHVSSYHLHKVYTCVYCQRTFTNKTLRSRHYEYRKESNSNLRRCNKCCQRFKSDLRLDIHQATDCGGKLEQVSVLITTFPQIINQVLRYNVIYK